MANIEWKSSEELAQEIEKERLQEALINQEERIKYLETIVLELVDFI